MNTYGLFCPLAMACEIIEPRWTLLILAEMRSGATHFNEIRRGVPGISPTLLSKRLKVMEEQGLIERLEDDGKGTVDYVRTPMAIELDPAILMLGKWAHRNIEAEVTLANVDPESLMWNLRTKINASQLPKRRVVVRIHLTDLTKGLTVYWFMARPGVPVDLCFKDPIFDVDLFIEAGTKSLASVLMGYSTFETEIANDRIFLSGELRLIKTIDRWLEKSQFAAASV